MNRHHPAGWQGVAGLPAGTTVRSVSDARPPYHRTDAAPT